MIMSTTRPALSDRSTRDAAVANLTAVYRQARPCKSYRANNDIAQPIKLQRGLASSSSSLDRHSGPVTCHRGAADGYH